MATQISRWVGNLRKSLPMIRRLPAIPSAIHSSAPLQTCALCGTPLLDDTDVAPHCAVCGDGDFSLALFSRHARETSLVPRTSPEH
jgi:hypothetical protein